MTEGARRWAFAAIALAALAGCGPSSKPAAPQATANATPVLTQPPTVLVLPASPDPDHDARPDRVKADDFTGRLDRVQSDLARVDADFLRRVRATLQSDTPADAKLTLADYRDQIAADIAALPGAPHLTGCFAKAQSLNATAEARLAAMLSDRRDKGDAIAAIADRPLTLPDFGGLATDIATGAGADDAKASLAEARASVAGCRDASGAVHRVATEAQAPTITTQPPTPAPVPSAVPPPKKPGLFGRLFGRS
jgi:hypothetical protein